ncbi:MAG: hypothetical protein ABFC34_17010 [Methanobacterium sp.]
MNEERIIDGILNFEKINPLLFTMNGPGNASYWKIGNIVGDAYKEGKIIPKS